ncbi:DUF6457 domain-containing protein [Kitasatospora kifunensis]|uniref:Putative membrane protein n=1 Tax=Kitasatospora kifunensis TaxID=58351 RepID=A0A7W7R350_KITKI|nr:putative membrane protein [Kitasatospora kifunensis]
MERTLDDWMTEAAATLGIDPKADPKELLDLARVVAHGVERPAAPLTTFLVGYAAAARGGGPGALTEAVRQVTALAERWAAQSAAEQPTDEQPAAEQSTGEQPTDEQPTDEQPVAAPSPQPGAEQRP